MLRMSRGVRVGCASTHHTTPVPLRVLSPATGTRHPWHIPPMGGAVESESTPEVSPGCSETRSCRARFRRMARESG